MNSQCLFVWFFKQSHCKIIRRQTRKVMFRVSPIPRLRCRNPPPVVRDELYHVKHPPLAVLGTLRVVKVYIPDQLPAVSDLISNGNSSLMEEYVFVDMQTSRCSREQRRSLFIWCAGVSTSPLQLLAYRGLLPLKGFWGVCSGIWHYTFVCSDSQT